MTTTTGTTRTTSTTDTGPGRCASTGDTPATTATISQTTTTGPTPCPEWCNGVHALRSRAYGGDSWRDDFHVRELAWAPGPLGGGFRDSSVRLDRPLDPEYGVDQRVTVWMRGDEVQGIHAYDFDADELETLGAMFTTAAANLRRIEALEAVHGGA
jgi:hypothetical protein